MNRKTVGFLVLLGFLSTVVCCLAPADGGNILYIAAMPFAELAKGLRALSLSDSAGNLAAILVYAIVCLMPLVFLLKKNRKKEDWLLVLGSLMLHYVLYLMINPGLMPMGMDSAVGNVILTGTVYSIFLTWAVLKLLRRGDSGYGALRMLLMICAVLYVVTGFGVGTAELKGKCMALRAGNTMPGQNLVATYVFLFLIFAVHALEYTLDASLMVRGIALTNALALNPYSESAAALAGDLSKKAQIYVATILISNVALNVGQILASYQLYHIDAEVRLPVFSVALCFGCMVLTRLLTEGKSIKEENDLYI